LICFAAIRNSNNIIEFIRVDGEILGSASWAPLSDPILEIPKFEISIISLSFSLHPSQISYGSEFRPSRVLEKLLQGHPFWPRLKLILDEGTTFPLEDITNKARLIDLKFHQDRGNHKSLSKYSEFIDPTITENIERGFALPLPIEILYKLPKASIAPLGCHKQTTINENGSIIPKYRLTHDQSFPGPSGLSVNLRVQKDVLPPIMYSYVLSRLIHYIVHKRRAHPTAKIYLCKVDLDSAYRRCSLSSSTAMESLTIYAGLLIVALRMTFGGAPCPNLWGVISETIADIGNTILLSSLWDHNSLFDPLSSQIELPLPLPDEIKFALAEELAVSLPENPAGYIDVYIDDNIGVTLDLGDNAIHLCRAIPLAIRTIARPLVDSDVIPRKDIISLKKFEAKGRLEEVKKILGWIINTRSLSITLPDDKFKAWSSDISK
jgi:hypothetical protein